MTASVPESTSPRRVDAPLAICIVALGAYPLFDPTVRGPMGGMESRAWIFARALARRGTMKVSFVVDDRGQTPFGEFSGITVYARRHSIATELVEAARGVAADMRALQRSGTWTLRRLTGLARRALLRFAGVLKKVAGQALRGVPSGPALYPRIPADVFLTFGVNGVSAEVVVSCRAHAKKSILCIAHDSDLDEVFTIPTRRRRADGVLAIDGCRALRQADEIVVQSQYQLDLLRERFERAGRLIANPIDMDADDTEGATLEPQVRALIRQGPYVLWIGRSDPVFKQPDVCLELAARLPDVRFVMVMALCDANLHDEIRRRKPANVEIIDGLPFRAMPHLFRWAAALASTSRQEGFPNIFLQAGKYRVPVVSLNVDPDGLFSKLHAGIICHGSVEQMAGELCRLTAEPEHRSAYANRLARYVADNHGLAGRCDELCEAIEAAIRPAEALPARMIHAPTPTRSASEGEIIRTPSLALRVGVNSARSDCQKTVH
jgi:glycosyltransferase involved in cell wall biosynthesis